VYARAHYVKLFYHFNPDKFAESYKQINDFDSLTHKNTIDTYIRAVDKLHVNTKKNHDISTLNLLSACKELSTFSKNFVENIYPKAISYNSKKDPLTDDFFIEINQYVEFDHNIGVYDKNKSSFKRNVESYKNAVAEYMQNYRKSIPSDFVNSRS